MKLGFDHGLIFHATRPRKAPGRPASRLLTRVQDVSPLIVGRNDRRDPGGVGEIAPLKGYETSTSSVAGIKPL